VLKPRIRKTERLPTSGAIPVVDCFWGNTRSLLKRGAVVPIISNFISTMIFGNDPSALAMSWAMDDQLVASKLKNISPLSEEDNRRLARVAQYYSVKDNPRQAKVYYLTALKAFLGGTAEQDGVDPDLITEVEDEIRAGAMDFSEMAYRLGYPKFDQPDQNPLRLLAELPLPIYITTSHHRFLEAALDRTNPPRQPVSEIFYWDDSLTELVPSIYDEEPNYEPSIDRPLVYHLYGLDSFPESLVLTEDDFLDFLIKVTDPNKRRPDQPYSIPSSITGALARNALLLLGYVIYEWEFRVLFRGMIRAIDDSRANNPVVAEGISMQIEPGPPHRDPIQVKEYLDRYFEKSNFRVYWGGVDECVRELYKISK